MKKLIFSFCLVIFNNCFCEVGSIASEQIIKKLNINKNSYQTLTKRQLGDDIDDDAGDVYAAVERDVIDSSKFKAVTLPVVPTTTPNQHRKVADKSCSCRKKKIKDEEGIRNLVDFGEKLTVSNLRKVESRGLTNKNPRKSVLTPTTTTTGPIKIVLNETHFELKEAEFLPHAVIKEVCPHFKNIPDLDIEKMVDVWQLLYYKASEKLSCFKIYVKKTTPENRKHYEKKFSTFNDTIDWKRCYLELNSVGKPREDRKHFLQGFKNNKGILENIVLSEDFYNDTRTITLQEQSPDQWMVSKNLLLMRDCENGDVVVFSRLPTNPERREVEAAMFKFGEKDLRFIEACAEYIPKEDNSSSYAAKKYAIIS